MQKKINSKTRSGAPCPALRKAPQRIDIATAMPRATLCHAWRPTPRAYLYGGYHARHDVARGMAARHTKMRCVVGHVAPNAWGRPSKRRHVPHHTINVSMANRHAVVFVATWRSTTGRNERGVFRHDYIF